MQIDAPFSISIVDNPDSSTRELHLDFIESFKNAALDVRITQFKEHLTQLNSDLLTESDENTKQGMLTILQVSEQLLPHIIQDEIPLDETIIIEIGPSSPFDNIIRGATLK